MRTLPGETLVDITVQVIDGPGAKRTIEALKAMAAEFIESHKVPIAQVNLVVLSGSGDDPAGKYGVASLAAAMLDEGAGSRNALELSDAIDVLGATLATASSFDASVARLNVPVGHLDEAQISGRVFGS